MQYHPEVQDSSIVDVSIDILIETEMEDNHTMKIIVSDIRYSTFFSFGIDVIELTFSKTHLKHLQLLSLHRLDPLYADSEMQQLQMV